MSRYSISRKTGFNTLEIVVNGNEKFPELGYNKRLVKNNVILKMGEASRFSKDFYDYR